MSFKGQELVELTMLRPRRVAVAQSVEDAKRIVGDDPDKIAKARKSWVARPPEKIKVGPLSARRLVSGGFAEPATADAPPPPPEEKPVPEPGPTPTSKPVGRGKGKTTKG